MMARTDKEGSQERRVERHSEKAMEVSRLLKRGSGVIEWGREEVLSTRNAEAGGATRDESHGATNDVDG